MIPYNASEYYKKMLDLQERLRKSEEERIRLEERFALLEHESRSRHESCINRLRMRYIVFLEEQQARDERNHQLLGALDRVDSSLALMTAKTDRLGALRKQYENSLLAGLENRRANGSVTGDSGVASQHEEKYRKCGESYRGRESSSPSRSVIDFRQRTTDSNVARPISHGNSRSGNYSGLQLPAYKFSFYPQADPSEARNEQNRVQDSNYSQSPRYEGKLPHGSSTRYRLSEFKVHTPEYKLRPSSETVSNFPKFGKSVRDLSTYESGPRFADRSSPGITRNYYGDVSGRNIARRNSMLPSEAPELRNSESLPGMPKLSEILKRELGDEELSSSLVENQLENYISKIRSLHQDPDMQRSIEEVDHEQNTSGDLLNVTLSSDDEVPLAMEDKPGEKSLAPELGRVLSLAEGLAKDTSNYGIAEYPETILKPSKNENNDLPIIRESNVSENADTSNRLESNRRPDEASKENQENIRETPKSIVNNVTKGAREPEKSQQRRVSIDHSNLDSRYKLSSGKEFIDEDIHELAEDLEPWNLSALERRVQEIILNDEAQDNFFAKGVRNNVNETIKESARFENSGIKDTSEDKNMDIPEEKDIRNSENSSKNDEKIDEAPKTEESLKTNAIDESKELETSLLEKSANRLIPEERSLEVDRNGEHETKKEVDYPNQEYQGEYSQDPSVEYQYNNDQYQVPNQEYSEYDKMENVQYEGTQDENYGYGEGYVQNQEHYLQDTSQENYVQDPNQENYVQNPNDENYTQNRESYVQNPNEENYMQDPSQEIYKPDSTQQNYAQDPNQENYMQDPSQENYTSDPNQKNYMQDPSQENYTSDPNQENYLQDAGPENYTLDPAQQNYAQDPNKEGYIQDPNEQNYVQDLNEQNYTQDPNQQDNIQDSTQQEYIDQQYGDPNQVYLDPNQQEYADNNQYTNQEYSVDQYAADSNQEYQANFDQGYVDPSQQYPSEYPYQREEYPHDESYVEANENSGTVQRSENEELETKDSKVPKPDNKSPKRSKDVIKSILESDTESSIERNVTNTESDFDFN